MIEVYFTPWAVDDQGDADREVCFTFDRPEFVAARCGRIVVYADGEIDVAMFGDKRDISDHPCAFTNLVEAERWAAEITRKRGEESLRRSERWVAAGGARCV